MSQKEPLSRPVLITGVVVPVTLGVLAIVGPLLTARLQPPSAIPATTPSASLPASSPPEQTTNTPTVTDITTGEDGQDVTVSAGNTANMFDGRVFIALLKTQEDGNPPHNTVWATLSSDNEGIKDRKLKGVDAGFSYIFNGFKVRVMSIEANSARFRVTRLPIDPTPPPTGTLSPKPQQ
jgi:hypothetical protein